MRKKLSKILKNPKTHLITGCMLLFAGLFEVLEISLEEFVGFDIKTHHGIIIYALVQIIISILDVIEGVEKIEKSTK